MVEKARTKLLSAISIAAVLAGLLAAGRAVQDIPRISRHIRDKVERIEELERIRARRSGSPEARSALESLTTHQPPDLQKMCGKLLPDIAVDIQEEAPVSVGAGWMLRQAQVRVDRVLLGRISRLIGSLEGERPPWRVRECRIVAAPGEPGYGRVSLQLEALHKENI